MSMGEETKVVMDEEVAKNEEASEQEVSVERPYTLRKFKDGDLWPLLQILKKIGIRDFKDAFFQIASGEKSVKEIGVLAVIDMADIIIGNIGKVQEETYALWADISGIPAEEIKEMEFGTLPLMIMDSFAEVKNVSFFKVLFKLLK